MTSFMEILEELNKHLACDHQNWLFGAGISYEAHIPLMSVLTDRVGQLVSDNEAHPIYTSITEDLPEDYHIEHVLSHIGDFIAVAERSKHSCITLNGEKHTVDQLLGLHSELITYIGTTVRYGYKEESTEGNLAEKIGTVEEPIIDISNHRQFVRTLLALRSNLLSRSSITIFTTNYDTLLEDALALEGIHVNDGFMGAAIGYWRPDISFSNKFGINVVKLHGSIDWYQDGNGALLRMRDGVYHLKNENSNLFIYPQATKYLETQKDPFAALFARLRERLNSELDNILVAAGYSFRDSHINAEIELALRSQNSKTILIVFIDEINDVLSSWIDNDMFSHKLYIATKDSIYHKSEKVEFQDGSLKWWQFSSLIKFLKDGDVLEFVY